MRVLAALMAVATLMLMHGASGASAPRSAAAAQKCSKPKRVQAIEFDVRKYRQIRRHMRVAIRRGWPRVLVLNRRRSEARRDRLLADSDTKAGFDRDEYPPAVGRGRGKGLERGKDPRGWRADVAYVDTSENRSHGASLGGQLRRYCDGTRFKYVFG